MGRPHRIDHQGGWHHVMNRGAAQQATFRSDRDRVEFERLLGVGHHRFGVDVHAYCLMTNHFHLLVHCPRAGLSDFMHQLGSVFTRHHNKRVGRDGPLFRGRFHAIPIHTDDYRLRATRYIHRNPLDIDASLPLDRYRWSSHRIYTGNRRPPEWMRTDVVLGWFDGDADAFDRFVADDDIESEPRIGSQLEPAVLAAIVELVIDELAPSVARQRLARTVSLLVADQFGSTNGARLAQQFGYPDRRAYQEAVWRARRRAAAEPLLGALTERALRLVA